MKEAALCQMRLFNCIIGIRFEIDGDSDRTNGIIHSIYGMAEELSAFVLYPNMYLYHWDGRLLLSIDGKSDFEEFYPQASTTILDREVNEEEADRERKMRSIAILKEKGIPFLEHLKASVFESECKIPDKEVIIHRLACILPLVSSLRFIPAASLKTAGKWRRKRSHRWRNAIRSRIGSHRKSGTISKIRTRIRRSITGLAGDTSAALYFCGHCP